MKYCENLELDKFNKDAILPYGLKIEDIRIAMENFLNFLERINQTFEEQGTKIEKTIMPANFSSIVSELMILNITKINTNLIKNKYPNGHPDIIPSNKYKDDKILHGEEGIEVKSSRNQSWQGHNAEDVFILIFKFICDYPESEENIKFKFDFVGLAKLEKSDWSESGRGNGSRRTPTASIIKSGKDKIMKNWIYKI